MVEPNIFSVGERVTRTTLDGRMRKGVITKVSHSYKNYLGERLILYAVRWDDTGNEEGGYLGIANGLQREKT